MILLFSGGMDSFVAYHYLNKPKTIYVNLGHRYNVHELEMVKKLIPNTISDHTINLSEWEEKDANIPLRNAFLVMIASRHDKDVVLVVQRGEMNIPDRSPVFFNEFAVRLSHLWEERMTISTPFMYMTKTDIVRWYLDKGLPPEILISTRSCFSPDDQPCGACAACFRRWVAFTNCGIGEQYQQDITKYDGIQEYIRKMKAGKYDLDRTRETFDALKTAGIL